MKRLTMRNCIGRNEYIRCFDCQPKESGYALENCGYCGHWQEVLDRLAAYEDTGLLPEDCAEYKKFENTLVSSGKSFQYVLELLEAECGGRLYILCGGYTDADGEEALRTAMYRCGVTNNPVTRYTADAIAEKLVGVQTRAVRNQKSTYKNKNN